MRPSAPSSISWMYIVLVDETRYGLDSKALLRKLEQSKIQTRPRTGTRAKYC